MGVVRHCRSGGDLGMIERWLADFERHLRVHGRRRRRIVEELAAHLHQASAMHGDPQAIARIGDAEEVARSFTPRLGDRAFEQRDRLAAVMMLAAMAASLPLAWTLQSLGRSADSWAWAWFFAFLAPTAAMAAVSCVAVLRRRPLGARLAPPLVGMVLLTSLIVLLDLPPAQAEFRQYRLAEIGVATGKCFTACPVTTPADMLAGCDRDPNCVANDHAFEIRFNYSAGAVLLSLAYLWAVTGWKPRRRRLQSALA
jgi:hypothetical protein